MAMSLKAIAIFCLAIVPISHCYDNIDAFMSGDQIQQIFHADASSVPLHEVVEINFHERNKRDLFLARTRITIRAFGEDHQLWLHPTERVLFPKNMPIYWARYWYGMPENVLFTQDHYLFSNFVRLYENPTYLASLVIGEDAYGKFTATGHIGKRDLAIKPLPDNVVSAYVGNNRSIDNSSFSNSALHVVYKTNKNFEHYSIDAIDQTIREKRNAPSTDQVPSVIYPKILLFVDYSTYSAHSSDLPRFMEYLLAFWNGVDLKYRSLMNPQVRLHISALVIAMDYHATPYISNNLLYGNQNVFNMSASYNAAQYFFYAIRGTFPLASYDIAFTMTKLNIFSDISGYILGFAYRKGVCRINYPGNFMRAVAFGQDLAGFAGIHTAAHELGHVLGVYKHDGEGNECSATDGYIMAESPTYTKNSSTFSKCSIGELQSELDNGNLKCLYNKPQTLGEDMPKIMPGKIMSLEAQCAARGAALPCYAEYMDICVSYACFDLNGKCLNYRTAALDGTPCRNLNNGVLGFCLKNECVHLPQAKENLPREPLSWWSGRNMY